MNRIMDRLPGLRELSGREKLLLIDEIYDNLESDPDAFPPTPEIVAELDRRMTEYEIDPSRATTWETLLERLRQRVPQS